MGSRAGASFDITTSLASVGRQDPEAQTMDTQSWPGVAMTCLSLGCVCTALGDFQPRQGEGGGLSEIRSTGTGVQSIGSLFRFAPSCHENISVKKNCLYCTVRY